MATQIEAQFDVVPPTKTDSIERTPPMPPVALAQIPNTSLAIMDRLIERNASLEQMKDVMAFIREQEAHEAEKLYNAAMSAFKAHDIHVGKDKDNKQYNSKYTSLGNLISTVTPFLSQHRLSASWTIDQSSAPAIKVTCIMKHEAGHSDSVSMVCGPDKSGAKNPIQEIKSAITYLKACTFESICGLASTDANLDDDGNAAGGKAAAASRSNGMDADDLEERLKHFDNCLSYQEVDAHYKASFHEAHAAKDQNAKDSFIAAKKTAYARLRERQ